MKWPTIKWPKFKWPKVKWPDLDERDAHIYGGLLVAAVGRWFILISTVRGFLRGARQAVQEQRRQSDR